jgi:hypothetical protein
MANSGIFSAVTIIVRDIVWEDDGTVNRHNCYEGRRDIDEIREWFERPSAIPPYNRASTKALFVYSPYCDRPGLSGDASPRIHEISTRWSVRRKLIGNH